MVGSFADKDRVGGDALLDDVPASLVAAQPRTLPRCVQCVPLVRAHRPPRLDAAEGARLLRDVLCEEFVEVARADEADAPRVGLVRGVQLSLRCERTHLRLPQVADGEERLAQRLARHCR